MKIVRRSAIIFLVLFFAAFAAEPAFAHEVYVLSQAEILKDIGNPSPNPFGAAAANPVLFLVWVSVGAVLVAAIFALAVSKTLRRKAAPLLKKMKNFAPLVARLTLGLSLFSSAYQGALFGPELPLQNIFHGYSSAVQIGLFIIGFFITFGIFTRASSVIALLIFIWSVAVYNVYMLTYANYLGEIIINLILGNGAYALGSFFKTSKLRMVKSEMFEKFEPYSFFLLRVFFGIAVIYASFYAKFLHSSLALDTVVNYHLTNYFHFTPLFLTLGAFLVEAAIGVFIIIGFEIRFTALFFLTFLTLSLLYFGEVVWPHIILLGVNVALILHGYDKHSIMNKFTREPELEPVL